MVSKKYFNVHAHAKCFNVQLFMQKLSIFAIVHTKAIDCNSAKNLSNANYIQKDYRNVILDLSNKSKVVHVYNCYNCFGPNFVSVQNTTV